MTTRAFLNCGFGSPIGTGLLGELRALGWQGARQDVLHVVDAPVLADELCEAGMGAILVLAPAIWRSPAAVRAVVAGVKAVGLRDIAYEVGNELDGSDARAYAQAFGAAEQAAREADPGAALITAGTRNVSQDAIRWLAVVLGSELVSEQVTVAVHTYRGNHSPESALPGYTSRMDEWSAVAQVAGGRQITLSEIGWPDCKTSWWPCARPLSEGQVAQYLRTEIEIARQAGCQHAVVYQLGDGPSKSPLDHFGIRRRDGTFKPSAYVAKGA